MLGGFNPGSYFGFTAAAVRRGASRASRAENMGIHIRDLSFGLAAALAAAACSSSSSTNNDPKTLEVYSWLTSGSENKALTSLLDNITSHDHRMRITNAAQKNPSQAQDQLKTRMAEGDPPDSFQVVSGKDLDDWIERGALESLDSLAASQGWGAVIPARVLSSVSSDGVLYGVPLDIERDNTLFYNKAVFDAAGVDTPKTFADLMPAAAALEAKGIVAFAVSAFAGWTIASHLFESVLVAQAGPDFYQAYLTGQQAADTPEIRTALSTVASMMDYSNPDRTSTEWTGAVSMVCQGRAAMLVLPDFVKGQFVQDSIADGGNACSAIDYISMEPPGTPTFVFVSITFELPKGAPHRNNGLEFLTYVGGREQQDVFNPIKGSISARTDSDITKYDAISQRTASDFKGSGVHLVPAYAALTTASVQGSINAALKSFVDPSDGNYKDVDAVVAVLAQNYAALHP
jgi:glucose/mannose transport system substrate-binding protein